MYLRIILNKIKAVYFELIIKLLKMFQVILSACKHLYSNGYDIVERRSATVNK